MTNTAIAVYLNSRFSEKLLVAVLLIIMTIVSVHALEIHVGGVINIKLGRVVTITITQLKFSIVSKLLRPKRDPLVSLLYHRKGNPVTASPPTPPLVTTTN